MGEMEERRQRWRRVTGEWGKEKGKKEGRQRGRADRELPEFSPEIACCNRRGELIGYDSPAVEF